MHCGNSLYTNLVGVLFSDAENNRHQFTLIVYHFPPDILPESQKHGNSNNNTLFSNMGKSSRIDQV